MSVLNTIHPCYVNAFAAHRDFYQNSHRTRFIPIAVLETALNFDRLEAFHQGIIICLVAKSYTCSQKEYKLMFNLGMANFEFYKSKKHRDFSSVMSPPSLGIKGSGTTSSSSAKP